MSTVFAFQTLTYSSNVLENGGQGAALVEACWPALRQLAPELQDRALNGPVMQAVTTFENMQQVGKRISTRITLTYCNPRSAKRLLC
jgi:hypothetical protein